MQFTLQAITAGALPAALPTLRPVFEPMPWPAERAAQSFWQHIWRHARRGLPLLAVLLLSALLAACGGGGGGGNFVPLVGASGTGTTGGEGTVVGGSNTPSTPTTPSSPNTPNTSTETAPAITGQPSSVSVTAGQAAQFSVAATGSAPLAYQWRRNGSAISGATSASYAIPATALADDGAQFSVVVSNDAGSLTSDTATLTVHAAAGGGAGKMSLALNGTTGLASRADGSVWGWLEVETTDNPAGNWANVMALPGLAGITQVAVTMDGGEFFALKDDGTVLSWGSHDENGIEGNGSRETPHLLPNATTVVGLNHVVQVSAGIGFAIALKDSGEVYAWGNNEFRVLGQDQSTYPWTGTPLQVPGIAGAKKVSAGGDGAVALLNDGTVMQWGYLDGQSQAPDVLAVHATPGLTDIVDIAAGINFWVALRSDGAVFISGDFGGGGGPIYTAPTQNAVLSGAKAVAATQDGALLVLMNDGTVMAWGYNINGEVGNGSTANFVSTPQQVTGLTGIIQIAGGRDACLALRSDGTVAGWGGNQFGVLAGYPARVGGPSSQPEYRTPVTIPGLNLLTS